MNLFYPTAAMLDMQRPVLFDLEMPQFPWPNSKNLATFWSLLGPMVVAMNICRTTPRLVTSTPGDIYSLSLTPDASKLVFSAGASQDGNLQRDVFSVNSDGSELRKLTDRPELSWQASVSPDGSEIAYVVEKDGRSDLYAMNLDGSGDRRLTQSNAGFWEPLWAPEGKAILTTSRDTKGHNLELVIVNSDGSGQQQISQMGGGSNQYAAFSPDRQQIVFSSDIQGGLPQAFSIARDGSNPQRHSENVMFFGPASLSPQGTALFTGMDRWNHMNLYKVTLDGSQPQVRLETPPSPSGASFSPDGSRIAYTSGSKVYLAQADGGSPQLLTTDENRYRSPVFSPDGQSLFALGPQANGTAIYQIPLPR